MCRLDVMVDRVENHFRLFNEAVRRRDWTEFLATFTPDAVMRFEGVPVGPYLGRDAIAAAYAERPPTDVMSCVSVDRDGDMDVVGFAWEAGAGGTMRVLWRGGAVAELTVVLGSTSRASRYKDVVDLERYPIDDPALHTKRLFYGRTAQPFR
jgi:steroid delta-isomerase